MSRLLLNLRAESARHHVNTANGAGRSITAQTLTDTNLIFTTRFLGNLTAEFEDNGDNYYTYGGTTDDEDDVRALRTAQSGHSMRSGYSTRTGRSAMTGTGSEAEGMEFELGSMSGTGTFAGSSSGSASDSRKGKGKGRAPRGGRSSSRGGWSGYTSTGSSSMGGAWDEETHVQSPTSAADDPHVGLFTNRRLDVDPSARRPAANTSPLSPTSAQSLSPTLNQLSPSISSATYLGASSSGSSGGGGSQRPLWAGDRDGSGGEEAERGPGEDRENNQQRNFSHGQLSVVVGEAIEMTRMDRRRHGRGGGYDHDLHHDHYRQGPFTP